jgi:hypothetical protein
MTEAKLDELCKKYCFGTDFVNERELANEYAIKKVIEPIGFRHFVEGYMYGKKESDNDSKRNYY